MTAEKRTKRENGQGSFTKRSDGRWVGKMQIGWSDNGKPKVKCIYGKTLPEAKRKLKEYREEFIKNDRVSTQSGTVKAYMNNWLVSVKKLQVKPSSYDKIEYSLENLIYPSIGNVQLASLTADDIQSLINNVNDNYSFSTVTQVYHIIKDCLKLAVIKRNLAFNPALGAVLPKRKKEEMENVKFFNDEEVARIVNEATKQTTTTQSNVHRLGWALVLLLYTGMRYGELSALKWENVDFENKQIEIKATLSRVKNRNKVDGDRAYILVEQEPKTKASKRVLPLNNKALEAICEMKKVTGRFAHVLVNRNGEHIVPSSFQNIITAVLTNCNIEKRGAHTFRHTFASMLFKKGVDVKTVSELLGHSNVTVTYNTYIHLIQEQKVQAMELISF